MVSEQKAHRRLTIDSPVEIIVNSDESSTHNTTKQQNNFASESFNYHHGEIFSSNFSVLYTPYQFGYVKSNAEIWDST